MLTIIIGAEESFNDDTQEFLTTGGVKLDLEHSLVSLSKWESKFEKPFLSTENKTTEETKWYINAMILSPEVPQDIFDKLSNQNMDEIDSYIRANMTATWFNEKKSEKPSREVITAEVFYYMMIALGIPFECQYWHINRLLTLIKVCNIKNAPTGKVNRRELADQRRMMNQERKAKLNTTG